MALYHTARGSVDYTVVGSPTIVDGVVSGFSSSDYLETSVAFPGLTLTDLEVQFCLPNTIADKALFRGQDSDTAYLISFSSGGSLYIITADKQYYTNSPVLSYKYFKIIYSATSDTCSIMGSNDNNTWTDFNLSYNPATRVPRNEKFRICRNATGMTLDLKETYIKVNGQPWFGMCPIEVQKHQLMGPVGYTVVGSPTIVNGVASGFSSANYLNVATSLSSQELSNFEVGIKFTTGNSVTFTDRCALIRNYSYCTVASIDQTGHLGMNIFYKDSENVSKYQAYSLSDYVLSTNTTYKAVLSYDLSNVTISLYNTSGTLLATTTQSSVGYPAWFFAADFSFRIGCPLYQFPEFNGSIDLNETYVKKDGKLLYWQPQETKKIVVNGVEVWTSPVGPQETPIEYILRRDRMTLRNGIVSGPINSAIMLPAQTFQPGNNTWEIGLKFKTGANVSSDQRLFAFQKGYGENNRYSLTAMITNGKFNFGFTTDGSSWTTETGTVESYTVEANTDYFLKESWDGTAYKATVSKNGGAFQEILNIQSSTPIYNSFWAHYIGAWNPGNGSYATFYGNIDLNESYYTIGSSTTTLSNNFNIYSFEGLPILINGILQNTERTGGWAELQEPFRPGNNPWEIKMKFTNGDEYSSDRFLFRSQRSATEPWGLGIYKAESTQKLAFTFSLDGSSWWNNTIVNDYTLTSGTTYWLREWWDGSAYQAEISTDDTNYQKILNIPGTTPIYNQANITYIGAKNDGGGMVGQWNGKIYLAETYFNIG